MAMSEIKLKNGPIQKVSWGKFVINGVEHYKAPDGTIVGAGKDIRLIGDEVTPWRERKGHNLTRSMITGIFDRDIEVLIIGNGFYGALHVPDHVIDYIKSKGINKVIVERTPEACRLYNELYSKGVRVALLAHGTC